MITLSDNIDITGDLPRAVFVGGGKKRTNAKQSRLKRKGEAMKTMSTYNSCEFCYKLERTRGSSQRVIWNKGTVFCVFVDWS